MHLKYRITYADVRRKKSLYCRYSVHYRLSLAT